MNSFQNESLLYIDGRSLNAPQDALEHGVSLLYETVSNLTIGDVVLTAKVHAGNVALVEYSTTKRVFPQQNSTDQTHGVSDGVSLEEAVSWFHETVKTKEYGHVELACTVRDGRAVRVYCHSGDQHRVKSDDGVADAA